MKLLIKAGTVALLLALARFSVAAEGITPHRESTAFFTHHGSILREMPEGENAPAECIQQHEISPAYLSNPEVGVSRLRGKAINVLVLDLHDGMRRELATVATSILSEKFGMDVRVLVPEPQARWCDFPGLDWWTMCGPGERMAFLRRAADVPWVRDVDLILFSMPSVLLQLLRPLGKPMVVWIAVPPEYGRQNNEAYMDWLSDFRSAASDPSIAVVSASRYDQMYVRYFYGVDTEIIGLSTPGISSSSSQEERRSLVAAADDDEGGARRSGNQNRNRNRNRNRPHLDLRFRGRAATPCSGRKDCVSPEPERAKEIDADTSIGLFPKSSWKLPWASEIFEWSLRDLNVSLVDPGALEQYRAAIYLPYMRNTNLFLEIYRSGIPIFTPSIEFLVRLDQAHCLMSNRVYWSRTPEPCDRVYPYSPNELHYAKYPDERAPLAHAFWLERSEHFSSEYPGIIQFDSDDDLRAKLLAVDLHAVQETMKRQNQQATQSNTDAWARVISKLLGAGRVVGRGDKWRRVYRPGSSAGPLVQINGTCAPAVLQASVQMAQARINACSEVIGIDWDGFPARHSCATWPDVYGKEWPGGA